MHPATEPANVSESERLYAAWRIARAKWELARYAPANLGRDLCEEENDRHCDADHGALMAYFLHPAEDLHELARKLRTFREEDGTGFTRAAEIVEAFENDAFDLAFKHSGRVRRA
jgi:hypothetical protein